MTHAWALYPYKICLGDLYTVKGVKCNYYLSTARNIVVVNINSQTFTRSEIEVTMVFVESALDMKRTGIVCLSVWRSSKINIKLSDDKPAKNILNASPGCSLS